MISFSNPFSRPLHFLGLELVIIAGALLTLLHARKTRQDLFTWMTLFVYGVAMELITYSAFDNFNHGRFTVMFAGARLPLYVVAFYPFIIYSAFMTVAPLGLSRAAEPLVVGLAIVLLDVPFDINGPDAGWWAWSPTDENLRARWLGVPVTSYYWHLAFGAALVAGTRSVAPWVARSRATAAALAAVLPLGAIFVGILAFIPFHLLKRAGVPDGDVVALLIAGSAAILLLCKKTPRPAVSRRDLLVLWAVALHLGYELVVRASLWAHGGVADGAWKALVTPAVTTASLALSVWATRPRLERLPA
jgi:hypothetical protein